ncbi:MAG: class I SAM-dependent methyltransferase [Bacteroidales bacterium]
MAADVKRMIADLLDFYDFSNKVVLSVGAGGGQFIEYGRVAKQVIAIDNDKDALARLDANLRLSSLSNKFTLINSDFYAVNERADVVMFEFCLHEMSDAELAIQHARIMAPEILVTDHWPKSEWAYVVDEEEKVIKSWAALRKFNLKNVQQYDSVQFFHTYDELFQKVKVQGEQSIRRISKYKGLVNFTIPMSYGFACI